MQSKGREAQRFIEEHWHIKLVAHRYLTLIADVPPNDWMFEPTAVHYLYGCGLSAARVRETVHSLIAAAGISALQLSHRPDLEQAYQDLAERLASVGAD